ncbi:MAG: hydroxymethylglutaryl-CoA lyase [Planctomycetes bacterium]|nr:hydroxymethylglutaryl-CoA lyase [Planctomycetota bacterium]
MQLPRRVNIVEVCPRDGFQAEVNFISTAKKVELINSLSQTGVGRIEVTSFVHPRVVPNLADAAKVMRSIQRRKGVKYRVLVPNLIGAQRAIDCGTEEIIFVLSASESHNLNNVKKTIKESLEEFNTVVNCVQKNGLVDIHAALSTTFGCPFEGKIAKNKIVSLVKRLADLGATQIILADTTGMANPVDVAEVIEFVEQRVPINKLAVHFHNTRDAGLSNVLSALQQGITTVEASVGGLGGCPFAPGATGNIATEDLVNMLEEMNIDTGVNLSRLIACAILVEQMVGRELHGQVIETGRMRSKEDDCV